jgi:hypothetical protein
VPRRSAAAAVLERRGRRRRAELHLVHRAVAPDREAQPLGQRVHHRDADAVQAAGYLVAVGVELAAGVQLGHHDLGRRALELVVLLDAGGMPRPLSSTEIELSVWMVTTISSQNRPALVDRVVDHLEHHVVQPVPSEVSPMYIPGACAPPRGPSGP